MHSSVLHLINCLWIGPVLMMLGLTSCMGLDYAIFELTTVHKYSQVDALQVIMIVLTLAAS